MTEAYAERDPQGVTSRGYLTILGRETLMKPREWNGAGIDPATGMAFAGRYADGSPMHLKFLTPRYGTRHALVSGTTGSGKTELLNLICWIAIVSGIVPVILDPQERTVAAVLARPLPLRRRGERVQGDGHGPARGHARPLRVPVAAALG
jgi:hypothetical protein